MNAEKAESGRIVVPPSPWYCLSGMIVGAAAGLISACAVFAYIQYDTRHQMNDMIIHVGTEPLPAMMVAGTVMGAGSGCYCGLVLFAIAWLWPASMHPVRSGAMCASLGGTFWLLMFAFVFKFPSVDFAMSLRFAGTLLGGAFWGFVTSWIVQLAMRLWNASPRMRASEVAETN